MERAVNSLRVERKQKGQKGQKRQKVFLPFENQMELFSSIAIVERERLEYRLQPAGLGAQAPPAEAGTLNALLRWQKKAEKPKSKQPRLVQPTAEDAEVRRGKYGLDCSLRTSASSAVGLNVPMLRGLI